MRNVCLSKHQNQLISRNVFHYGVASYNGAKDSHRLEYRISLVSKMKTHRKEVVYTSLPFIFQIDFVFVSVYR